MRLLALFVATVTLLGPRTLSAQTIDLDRSQLVDLTHSFNERTIYWPTAPSSFEMERLAYGRTEAGFFYAANAFCTPEHGGTHLDAPVHFAEGRHAAAEVPLEKLVAPAVVIDVSEAAASDRSYRLTPADVRAFERRHGRIEAGTIVLLRTDWSRHWPDARAYLGGTDAADLEFPGYGPDAARLLVEERDVAALGVDAASIDHGPAATFPVHQIAGAANVPGLENLTGLDALPPTGAVVVALPMKIEDGSGGPVRVVAFVPEEG